MAWCGCPGACFSGSCPSGPPPSGASRRTTYNDPVRSIVERKLWRQLTEDGNVEIRGRDLR